MSTDVQLYKFSERKLVSKIDEIMDASKYAITFDFYVEQNNTDERRTGYFKLNGHDIVRKAKTNSQSLTPDEFNELIRWVTEIHLSNYDGPPNFDDEYIKRGFFEFGIEGIDYFRDNAGTFLFAYGDFLFGYFNDFEGSDRRSATLTHEEFILFLDYVICLYSTVITIDGKKLYEDCQKDFKENIEQCSTNLKVKEIVAIDAADLIEWSSFKDGERLFGRFGRETNLSNLDNVIYHCKQIKQLLINNECAIVTLYG